ncbi:hypothetical protein [Citrobacter phage Tr1]|nr:hypothetical protein [Citrobacter phage Tr1]
MTRKLTLGITLTFNDEDMDLGFKLDSEGIENAKEAAMAIFFKDAVMAYAEQAARQSVQIGSLVEAIETARDDWE